VTMCNLAIKDLDWMKPCDTTYGSGVAAAKKLFPKMNYIVVCKNKKKQKKDFSAFYCYFYCFSFYFYIWLFWVILVYLVYFVFYFVLFHFILLKASVLPYLMN
jgi:hypothetical protein